MENNLKVALVDKRCIGMGSTSGNTGLVQFINDKTLTSCINSFGEEVGVRFYKLCEKAIGDIESISKKLYIDIEFTRKDSLYYASNIEDLESLKEEFVTLKKYGFKVKYLDRKAIESLFSFSKNGAIYVTGDAQINPYKLTHSLIDYCYKKGLQVFESTHITSHKSEKSHVIFHTKNGYKIKTNKAIFTTGYETLEFKSMPIAMLQSTYSIVTNPIEHFKGWHNRCLIWETARPYLYMRTTNDNRIIVGGQDEYAINLNYRDSKLLGKRDSLFKDLKELFPHIQNIHPEYYWSATFASTHDGLPLIGEHPEYPNCYFSLGYGGNGMIYSCIGAQIIKDLIIGGNNHDSYIFSLHRKTK